MAKMRRSVEITESLDVLALVREIVRTGESCTLRHGATTLAVLSPRRVASRGSGVRRRNAGDPLRGIIGIADSEEFPDTPDDVSENKHKYLSAPTDESP
jgi:hypothetical protein